MKQIQISLILVVSLLLSGCSLNPFKGKERVEEPQVKLAFNVEVGRVINRERLMKGGDLVIKAIKAGPNVEATDQLDKISLSVVRGITDQLKGNKPYFSILLDEDDVSNKLVMKGYVTEIKKISKKRWLIFKNKKKQMSVKGRIVDEKTGETILSFSDTIESKDQNKDYKALGYELGETIGQFIVSGSTEY